MIDSGTDRNRVDGENENPDAERSADGVTPEIGGDPGAPPQRSMKTLLAIVGGAIAALVLLAVFVSSPSRHRAAAPAAPSAPSALAVAETQLRAGHPGAANAAAERALTSDPSDAATADRVASIAHRTHDNPLYERALWLSAVDAPANWRTYALLGDYFVRRHRDNVAAKELAIGISVAPQAPGLHYKLAEIERRQHRNRDAFANYRSEPPGSPYADAARRGAQHEARLIAMRPRNHHGRRQNHGKTVIARNQRHPQHRGRGHQPQQIAQHRPPHHRGAGHRQTPVRADVAAHPLPLIAGAHVGPHLPSGLSNEARAYLAGATEDFSFTRALPHSDAYRELSSASFDQQLSAQLNAARPNLELLLRMGSAALEGGDTNSALQAFSAASSAAPRDWRGPYFAGLSEEANNELDRATRLFQAAERRARRPEPLTSLALLQLRRRDLYGAERSIRQAIEIDPQYAPARFTEGALALVRNDPVRAQEELSTTLELPWAPQRAAYFLNRLNGSRTVVNR